MHIDIFDEFGIGGGASGVAGGLLHPYSPKVKLLWRGDECWGECLNLLNVAEEAAASRELSVGGPRYGLNTNQYIVRRRMLRIASQVVELRRLTTLLLDTLYLIYVHL